MDAFAFSSRRMLGGLADPLGSARALSFGALAGPLGSALAARAYFLLLRQKKVAKEKATPGSAPGVARSLALLGRPGGLLNSPAAQTDASRRPPAVLRCSAPLRGTRKASPPNRWRWFLAFPSGRPLKSGIFCPWAEPSFRDAFPGPHVERRATELMADKGRGLSEARRAEFRSPRQQRVAQGSRRSRPRSLGSPSSLATFFLAKQEESMPARKAEPPRQTRTTPSASKTPRKGETLTEHNIRR